MFYGLYPVDTDVPNSTAVIYQSEIILRLITNPKRGWYVCNIMELQTSNHTIGLTKPMRHFVTHQTTNWTQQMYKDKQTRAETQQLHHPQPTTSLTATAVTDTMKICPFCYQSGDSHRLYVYCDITHLHTHYSYE